MIYFSILILIFFFSYCVHLPNAVAHLEHLVESNPSLKKQVSDCQTQADPPTFPLGHFLVIPFQRFLKYHLMLQEILKRTPEEHTDHVNLTLGTYYLYGGKIKKKIFFYDVKKLELDMDSSI